MSELLTVRFKFFCAQCLFGSRKVSEDTVAAIKAIK